MKARPLAGTLFIVVRLLDVVTNPLRGGIADRICTSPAMEYP